MENYEKYYFNITYSKIKAVLRCQFPPGVRYTLPQISFLEQDLKEIKDKILEIEKYLPQGEKILISDKGYEGDFGNPIPKGTLTRLCNMLNKEKKEKIFKKLEESLA